VPQHGIPRRVLRRRVLPVAPTQKRLASRLWPGETTARWPSGANALSCAKGVIPSCKWARKRGGTPEHPPPPGQRSHPSRPRPKGATFDAVLPQGDSASVGAALAGVVTPGHHLIGDSGKAIAAFARRAGIPFHAVPAQESRPRRRLTCASTTSTPTTAASSNGSPASTASPPRTCPTISVGGAPSKPGAARSHRKPG
jgi:hypothetical protein